MKEPTFENIVDFCKYAACQRYGPKYPEEELWRRIELTLYNRSRRIITEMENMR